MRGTTIVINALLVLLVAPAHAGEQSSQKRPRPQTRRIAPQPTKALPARVQPQNRRVAVLRAVPAQDRARVRPLPTRNEPQLRQLLSAPNVVVMSPLSVAASLERNKALRIKLRQQFTTAFRANPALIRAVPSGTAELYADQPVSIRLRKGGMRLVRLLSADALIRDTLITQRLVTDTRHQASLYDRTYKRVSQAATRSPKALRKLRALPAPAALANRPASEINARLIELLGIWGSIGGPSAQATVAPGASPCEQEAGYGYGGDQQDGGGTGFSPNGLHEKYSWPLKPFDTCVRNQGDRGACTAFAATGAVEALVAVQYGRRVNLSEQDLYKHARLDWGPIPPDFYGDGHFAELSLLAQLVSGYTFPEERSWDYNPSFSRVANDTTHTYSNSCVGYRGEACSDTNHQAALQCYSVPTTTVETVVTEICEFVEIEIPETSNSIINFLAGAAETVVNTSTEWVCRNVEQAIETVGNVEVCVYQTDIAGTSGYRVTGFQTTGYLPLDRTSKELGMLIAKLHLDNREPVALSFLVPASFHNPDEAGFVLYNPADAVDGGHCVLVTGYVDNGYLPAGVPEGAGGGYLIIKNSWGKDWGDMGYGYLPYDWVRAYATTMTAVTSVGRS